jgi:hypothetical protein
MRELEEGREILWRKDGSYYAGFCTVALNSSHDGAGGRTGATMQGSAR